MYKVKMGKSSKYIFFRLKLKYIRGLLQLLMKNLVYSIIPCILYQVKRTILIFLETDMFIWKV